MTGSAAQPEYLAGMCLKAVISICTSIPFSPKCLTLSLHNPFCLDLPATASVKEKWRSKTGRKRKTPLTLTFRVSTLASAPFFSLSEVSTADDSDPFNDPDTVALHHTLPGARSPCTFHGHTARFSINSRLSSGRMRFSTSR